MILYVAGPMTGIPDFNYPAFNAAASDLREAGFEVLNPVDNERLNPTPDVPPAWSWCMRHALRMVLAAEGIALLPGHQNSRGARLELHVAQSLGLPCYPVNEWLDMATTRAITGGQA